METIKEITAREKLHHIVDIIDDDKVEAMLTLLHDVEEDSIYTEEFVAELDKDYEDYLNGAKTYSKEEVFAHTQELLKSLKEKK